MTIRKAAHYCAFDYGIVIALMRNDAMDGDWSTAAEDQAIAYSFIDLAVRVFVCRFERPATLKAAFSFLRFTVNRLTVSLPDERPNRDCLPEKSLNQAHGHTPLRVLYTANQHEAEHHMRTDKWSVG